MENANTPLLERIEDRRSAGNGAAKKDIAIFSPVGDLAQLEGFCSHVRELGLDNAADFIFVYRQGLKYAAHGLSALHACEKFPLGTSGAFFAGQSLSYSLGYKIIVVADLDAFLDSRATFDSLVKIAQEKKLAAIPLSKSPHEQNAQKGYAVVNQWGVFPRETFEECGLAIPYTYKGAEDFEFKQRLLHFKKLVFYDAGYALHPKEGMGIFTKLANRRKYFPYVSGIMKSYLFSSRYLLASNLNYVLWHSYYSFFADAFCDQELLRVLSNPFSIKQLNSLSTSPTSFTLKKTGGKKPASPIQSMLFLPALLLFKNSKFADCEIVLMQPRASFALCLAKATLLIPIRLAQGMFSLASQSKKASSLTFPIFPKNAPAASEGYISLLHQ